MLLRRRTGPGTISLAASDFAAAGPGPCEAVSSTDGVALSDGDGHGRIRYGPVAVFVLGPKVAHAYT